MHATRLRHLRSGHSHEDVDQVFGLLASHMAMRARNATGPPEFQGIIQDFLDNRLSRPHEPERHAVLLDQCRDWSLSKIDERQHDVWAFCVAKTTYLVLIAQKSFAEASIPPSCHPRDLDRNRRPTGPTHI